MQVHKFDDSHINVAPVLYFGSSTLPSAAVIFLAAEEIACPRLNRLVKFRDLLDVRQKKKIALLQQNSSQGIPEPL
jgi:hypothetical protein